MNTISLTSHKKIAPRFAAINLPIIDNSVSSNSGNTMNSDTHRSRRQTLSLLAAYATCGLLHELAHISAASLFLQSSPGTSIKNVSVGSLLVMAAQAVIGRYSLVQLGEDQAEYIKQLILHAGWMFSLVLALLCHGIHIAVRDGQQSKGASTSRNIFLSPILPMAAYITAFEAIVTDLLGFVPIHPYVQDSSRLICFCGNFGVLLLNPSWLSIDGGRTALDVLEKMVNVTMMRGMCTYDM